MTFQDVLRQWAIEKIRSWSVIPDGAEIEVQGVFIEKDDDSGVEHTDISHVCQDECFEARRPYIAVYAKVDGSDFWKRLEIEGVDDGDSFSMLDFMRLLDDFAGSDF